jgi:dolichyl-phosphate-mannose--protein O-mannosyl transferase
MTPSLKSAQPTQQDWLTALSLAALGVLFRIWHLASIKGLIFDEVYYAKNAHSLIQHGVELTQSGTGDFIVHPPIGKWMIGLGIKLFGFNEFGWRISAALVGSASIALMYFTAQKLFDNYFVSVLASLLIVFDGLHLVHSRTALLDIFLMFWLQSALLALLYSKHWWTGIYLGLATATKWTGLYYIVAIFLFVLYVDYRSQRALEESKPSLLTLRDYLPKRLLQYWIAPGLVYLTSFIGWFINRSGYDRAWANHRGGFWSFIPAPLRSLFHYQSEVLNFHKNLHDAHPYSANPWSWLIMGRPVSFYYVESPSCGASKCVREVLGLGTPVLWWIATISLAILFGYWLTRREWKSGLILIMVGAGYLPWFAFQKRTMFSFYAIAFEPFLMLSIAYLCNELIATSKDQKQLRVRKGAIIAIVGLVALCFIYFLPLYLGQSISYRSWLAHIWLPSWI